MRDRHPPHPRGGSVAQHRLFQQRNHLPEPGKPEPGGEGAAGEGVLTLASRLATHSSRFCAYSFPCRSSPTTA